MSEAAVPLAYWTGYAAIVLVSAAHIRPWAVAVPDAENAEAKSLVLPRRWLDIYGRKLLDVWEAAMRAVVGAILLRPGISQVSLGPVLARRVESLLTIRATLKAEIRWRLRSVYDRQEVVEILQTLHEEGYIAPRIDAAARFLDLGPADDREEKTTFWFLAGNSRPWHQV